MHLVGHSAPLLLLSYFVATARVRAERRGDDQTASALHAVIVTPDAANIVGTAAELLLCPHYTAVFVSLCVFVHARRTLATASRPWPGSSRSTPSGAG